MIDLYLDGLILIGFGIAWKGAEWIIRGARALGRAIDRANQRWED